MPFDAHLYGLKASNNANYPGDVMVTNAYHVLLKSMAAVGFVSYTESAAAPSGGSLNDLWYKQDSGLVAGNEPTGDGTMHRHDGTTWQAMSPSQFAQYLATLSGGITDADYGDVTVSGGGVVWTIDNNVVNNDKLADMSAYTYKMRKSGSGGNPEDVTVLSLTLDGAPSLGNYLITHDSVTGEPKKTPISGLGSLAGATNLAYTADAINGTVTSDTGTDATIPLADTSNAGLIIPGPSGQAGRLVAVAGGGGYELIVPSTVVDIQGRGVGAMVGTCVPGASLPYSTAMSFEVRAGGTTADARTGRFYTGSVVGFSGIALTTLGITETLPVGSRWTVIHNVEINTGSSGQQSLATWQRYS